MTPVAQWSRSLLWNKAVRDVCVYVLAVRDRGTAADPCLSCSVQDGLCPRVCTGTGQSTCCNVTQVCDAPLTIGQLALCDLSSVQVTPLGDRWCHFE